jgi:hypothetical protein
MKKSAELIELIETLKEDGVPDTVVTEDSSKAVVHRGRQQIEFDGEECKLLFSSVKSVNSFIEAIDPVTNANLELFNLELPDDVQATLEKRFSTVDEL